MRIRLSELKRIIAEEVSLASGNIRGGVAKQNEAEMCDETELYDEADEPKSSKRPQPRMPKRGKHAVTSKNNSAHRASQRRKPLYKAARDLDESYDIDQTIDDALILFRDLDQDTPIETLELLNSEGYVSENLQGWNLTDKGADRLDALTNLDESVGSRHKLERKLVKLLDALDRCDTDEDYRFPNGRPGPHQDSCDGDRAYGIELEIEQLLEDLEDEGYTEDEIIVIDPRVDDYF